MKVTPEEVIHFAKLAKLNLYESEIIKYSGKLSLILEYMDKLNELDTSDVEPLTHPVSIKPFLREDVPVQSISHEDALKNAPLHDGTFFLVPKVIK